MGTKAWARAGWHGEVVVVEMVEVGLVREGSGGCGIMWETGDAGAVAAY